MHHIIAAAGILLALGASPRGDASPDREHTGVHEVEKRSKGERTKGGTRTTRGTPQGDGNTEPEEAPPTAPAVAVDTAEPPSEDVPEEPSPAVREDGPDCADEPLGFVPSGIVRYMERTHRGESIACAEKYTQGRCTAWTITTDTERVLWMTANGSKLTSPPPRWCAAVVDRAPGAKPGRRR